MKKIICLSILFISVATSFAQKETFDLVTYTPPKDSMAIVWKKEVRETIVIYSFTNKKNNSWCQISIVKSTTSKGNIDQDFESEWKELIVKNYKPTEAPQLYEVKEADARLPARDGTDGNDKVGQGWKIKTGGTKFTFNNSDAIAMLTTMSGFNRCVSITAATNSEDYLKDIEALLVSVDLKKPEIITQQTPVNNDDKNSVTGTWGISASDQSSYAMNNGINGYISRQYTFNANGTYHFYIKTFQYVLDKLLLTKENGTYQINGNNITINPQYSVIQSWSKKNGADNWGKLLTTQNITLEKKTYQFTKHYFSGVQVWSLVLQADNPTKRDGPFNGGTAFSNAWLYSPITSGNLLIKLPD